MYLRLHQENHVKAMRNISELLESTANQLQEHLRFNHSSLRNAVEHLLLEVEQAQNYLDNEGPTIVTKVIKAIQTINFLNSWCTSLPIFVFLSLF